MSLQMNVHEAKTHFSSLLARVSEEEEEIIISRSGKPVARLTRLKKSSKKRFPGSAKGKISIAEDFNAPLPKSVLKAFLQ